MSSRPTAATSPKFLVGDPMNLSAAVAKVENEPTKLALRSAFTFTR